MSLSGLNGACCNCDWDCCDYGDLLMVFFCVFFAVEVVVGVVIEVVVFAVIVMLVGIVAKM